MNKDFGQLNSFTIETSSFGYEYMNGEEPELRQFKEAHLTLFGKELALSIAKHLDAEPT